MDRRERYGDQEETFRTAMEGKQAEIWTALPGVFQSFDPAALTASVQPAVQGVITDEKGKASNVNLPLLVDVPVVFPHSRDFALTFPVKAGDECLVVFASRCIDAWWQSGGVGAPAENRMHDLSDGFAIPGPWSQAARLAPPADPENVQLRTTDGKAAVTMKPDQTVDARNAKGSVTITPGGAVNVEAQESVTIKAPQITLEGNVTTTGAGGGAGQIAMRGTLNLDGSLTSTGDQVAEGKSTAHHTHPGDSGGTTGEPD